MSPSGSNESENTPAANAATPAQDDASTKEIFFFSLSGAADGFVSGAVGLMATLVMIVLKIDPLLVSMVMALVTVTTVLADPVMAHFSDNARFKMGRRLPFMLVFGILLAFVLTLGMHFFPRSSKTELNTPPIPSDAVSEKALVEFGRMLTAYDVPKTKFLIAPGTEGGDSALPAKTHELFLKSFKTMRSPLSAALAGPDDTANDLLINFGIHGLKGRLTDPEPTAAAGTEFSLNLAIGATENGLERHVSVSGASNEAREKRSLTQWISDVSRNESDRANFHYTGAGIDGTNLHIARRGGHRAVVYGAEIALIEKLGEKFRLPYWRALPDGMVVDPAIKERIRELLPRDRESYLPQLKAFAFASGYSMDLKSATLSADEQKNLAELSSKIGASTEQELHLKLWDELDFKKGSGRLTLYHNPLRTSAGGGIWSSINAGLKVWHNVSQEDRRIVIYVLIFFIVKFWVHSGFSAPAYALSIELAPSYHGRTKVIMYRAMLTKCVMFTSPWWMPFCLLPIFTDAVDGVLWLTVVGSILLIISVLLTVFNCKERTQIDTKTKKTPFFRTVKELGKNGHFWKICAINLVVGNSIGLFNVVGTMLGTYYVFKGDLLVGASYGAMIGTLASLIGLFGIPVLNWMCKRFQKHNAMRICLTMMIIGCVLKWWCYDPEHPEYQFILPFFFSFGIGGVMLILGTMMADVTDVDEMQCGTRREGMFGAVTAVVVRWISVFGTVGAGALVAISGFNIETGADQADGVFTIMRVLFSVVPAVLLCACYLILWRYPLTEERMAAIKAELAKRHREKAADDAVALEASA